MRGYDMSTTYERSSDSVSRISVGKNKKVRVKTSRGYLVYKFTSATAANAATSHVADRGGKLGPNEGILKAARDPRGILHVSEAAQIVSAAMLAAFGARPTGAHVANELEGWDGSRYLVFGNVVVTLPGYVLPSQRAIGRASVKAMERVPLEVAVQAREAHDDAVQARAIARKARKAGLSGENVLRLTA